MPSCLRAPPLPSSLPAFTFLEVLFAVILIGLGFIMIAGIFPVAIQQSQQNLDEAEGTAVCQDAINQIQQAALSPDGVVALQTYIDPSTGTPPVPVFEAIGPQLSTSTSNQASAMQWPQASTTSTAFYPLIAGSCVSKIDPRYAWCAFASRQTTAQPYMQVIVFAAKATQENQPTYSSFLQTAGVTQPTVPVPVFIPTTAGVQLNYG
ncbi:MAG TPA: hypothetical protein VMD30_08355, partial [Tepidisphaeraceae bacterium]|nr:hypothetical protein [Tepidisphaeraceae bacterium]